MRLKSKESESDISRSISFEEKNDSPNGRYNSPSNEEKTSRKMISSQVFARLGQPPMLQANIEG